MEPLEQRKQALAKIVEHDKAATELANTEKQIEQIVSRAGELSEHQPPVVVGKRRWGREHRNQSGSNPTLLEIANLLAEQSELETLRSRLAAKLAETSECHAELANAETACLTLWRHEQPERAAGIDTRDALIETIDIELGACDIQEQVAKKVLEAAENTQRVLSAATSAAFEAAFSPDTNTRNDTLTSAAVKAVRDMSGVCRDCDDDQILEHVAEFHLSDNPQLAELVDANDAGKVLVSLSRGLMFRVSERRHSLGNQKRNAVLEREALYRTP